MAEKLEDYLAWLCNLAMLLKNSVTLSMHTPLQVTADI